MATRIEVASMLDGHTFVCSEGYIYKIAGLMSLSIIHNSSNVLRIFESLIGGDDTYITMYGYDKEGFGVCDLSTRKFKSIKKQLLKRKHLFWHKNGPMVRYVIHCESREGLQCDIQRLDEDPEMTREFRYTGNRSV